MASTKRKPILVNSNGCTGATQENRRYYHKILRLILEILLAIVHRESVVSRGLVAVERS